MIGEGSIHVAAVFRLFQNGKFDRRAVNSGGTAAAFDR